MKFTLHKLKIGDLLRAQVVEMVNPAEYIVSFYGDLIRVRNESQKTLAVNERVLVRVIAIKPLAFQMVTEGEVSRGANRINVSI